MKRTLILSSIVAALGGFLFGFDTAVISGTTDWLKQIFELSSLELGFTVASALIGTIIGAMFIGPFTDKYGRRYILFILAVFYFVSALGSGLAWSWHSFIIFRFIGGLAVGGASVVSPMYIAEISPAKFRGRLVAVAQLNIVFGIMIAYFTNFIIAGMNLGDIEWRWMLIIETVPAAFFFLFLFATPRSPRWLIAKNLVGEARTVLEKCGTDSGDIEKEIIDIQNSLSSDKQKKREPLFIKKYKKPILLAIAIAAFNQLSGINAILYYAPSIFTMAGFGKGSALLSSMGVGGVMFIFTIAALLVMDSMGRKKIMIIGSIGYIISLGAIAWTFLSNDADNFSKEGGITVLIGLLVFVAAHGFGQGSVIWVYLSEIFPNKVRGRGQSLGTSVHWILAATTSWTFPFLTEISGGYTFVVFTFFMILQLIWVLAVMPETKGISLEEMEEKLGITS
jgi:sugar porter (SP) family MFS transporter